MLYKPGTIEQKNQESDKFFITGRMTAPIVDLEGDMITKDSYNKAINTVKQRASDNKCIPIFIEHRRKELSLPVGKIIDAWEKEDGLYFKGEIVNGQLGQPIRDLINGGYLYSVSIGGDALNSHKAFDPSINQEIKKITDFELREVSLTGLPVNPDATFSIAKSLNKDEREVKELMSKLDKGIDTLKLNKSLDELDISKAIDPANMDDAQLTKIKQYLDNLSKLLGIESTEGVDVTSQEGTEATGTTDTTDTQNNMEEQQEPTEDNVTDTLNKTNEEATTQSVNKEVPPKKEENVKNNEDKAMIVENYDKEVESDDNLLKKINEKLDRLLSEETNEESEEDNKIIDNVEDKSNSDDTDEQKDEDEDESESESDDKDDKKEAKGKMNKIAKMKKSFTEVNKMEAYKCNKCGNEFEKSIDYDAKFCPSCGDNLEKSIITEDKICEGCESVFEKSFGYEMSYCPKCGKSLNTFKGAMAVAPKASGEKVAYKGTKKAEGTGEIEGAAMATASKATGATPAYEAEEAKDTGASVEAYGDNDYIDDAGTTGETVANGEDEDINDERPAGKKLLNKVDASKFKTYGVKKSLEERLEKLEKSLTESRGRQTVIAPETTEIAKSTEPSKEDLDRNFVATLFGR